MRDQLVCLLLVFTLGLAGCGRPSLRNEPTLKERMGEFEGVIAEAESELRLASQPREQTGDDDESEMDNQVAGPVDTVTGMAEELAEAARGTAAEADMKSMVDELHQLQQRARTAGAKPDEISRTFQQISARVRIAQGKL